MFNSRLRRHLAGGGRTGIHTFAAAFFVCFTGCTGSSSSELSSSELEAGYRNETHSTSAYGLSAQA